MDIPSFLRRHPPFDDLDADELAAVVAATSIEFFPEGRVILVQGGAPAAYLYVVRTGAVEVRDGDHVVDLHQEGEVFGYVSLLTGDVPALTAQANEETICYLIEREVAERILASRRGVSFLSRSVRSRELSLLESTQRVAAADPWATPVSAVDARDPIIIDPATTVREAASVMTRERTSAVLVPIGGGLAIVTDRDLRSRVLAQDRSVQTPIAEIATRPLITMEDDDTIGEVLSVMLELGIHHVPITTDAGAVRCIVTDTDLMGMDRRSAFRLRAALERAASPERVAEIAREAPAMIADLVEASVDPLDVGHVAAATNDAVTRRLVDLAIAELGEPPCTWAWLALGSEARHEQGVATDQDNALSYEDEGADAYFAELAARVNEGLEQAGIPRCRAGVIASTPEWRGTLETWRDRFHGWVHDPGRAGSAFSGIAFDFRPVTGHLDVRGALDPILRESGTRTGFMRHLARSAIDQRPPKGFLKDAVVESRGTSAGRLDIKHAGITPITNLARVFALRAGVTDNRTVRRLRGAAITGSLEGQTARALEEAFRLLWQVRLEHQARQVRDDVPADDHVDPRSFGPLTRQALKEAFRMIERAQEQLALDLGLRR